MNFGGCASTSRERSNDVKHAFRINSLLFEFQFVFNCADIALKFDEIELLESVVRDLKEKYGEFDFSREQAH